MYNELYEAWKRELEGTGLERLSSDFYSKIADYLRRLKEEGRMLDKRTVKARLLKNEMRNVKRMIRELVEARYRKSVKKLAEGEKIPSDLLTIEEERIFTRVLPLAEAHQSFSRGLLRGYGPKVDIEPKRTKAVLRFLKEVPAIVGVDLETYGPFRVEDVGSLPLENSKILVRQGLAERVEV